LNSITGSFPRHAGKILVFRFQGLHSRFVLHMDIHRLTANTPFYRGNKVVRTARKTVFNIASTHPEGDIPVRSGNGAGSTHPASYPASTTVSPCRTHLTPLPSGGPFFSATSSTRTSGTTVSRASPSHGPPWCEGRSPPYAPLTWNPVGRTYGAGRSRQTLESRRCIYVPLQKKKGVPNAT
jgi:hypothetical protein